MLFRSMVLLRFSSPAWASPANPADRQAMTRRRPSGPTRFSARLEASFSPVSADPPAAPPVPLALARDVAGVDRCGRQSKPPANRRRRERISSADEAPLRTFSRHRDERSTGNRRFSSCFSHQGGGAHRVAEFSQDLVRGPSARTGRSPRAAPECKGAPRESAQIREQFVSAQV